MTSHNRWLFQCAIVFVVFVQLPLPGHSFFGSFKKSKKKKYCRNKFTEALVRAVKAPNEEPTDNKKRKIFNTYKCVTRKMREELISAHEDSRLVKATTECCSEIYYKEAKSKKCKKIAKRMKICFDFALIITEDLLTQGIYKAVKAQPSLCQFGNHPAGQGLVGGPHANHDKVPPFYDNLNPSIGMPPPGYDGYHPAHPMTPPPYGGSPPMYPMPPPPYGEYPPNHPMPPSPYDGYPPSRPMPPPLYDGYPRMPPPTYDRNRSFNGPYGKLSLIFLEWHSMRYDY
ncbi:hypothetical protein RF11_09064 [Thelohanellus kitauei]|uniref:Uncharacterized protein n=1 Tax=Thelohanellus kitauei TaxID=669202 RepID=A0A0C2M064_THEKT|nr:hypothetical protein RF11_09064 [Thelohanellus kitauei]